MWPSAGRVQARPGWRSTRGPSRRPGDKAARQPADARRLLTLDLVERKLELQKRLLVLGEPAALERAKALRRALQLTCGAPVGELGRPDLRRRLQRPTMCLGGECE